MTEIVADPQHPSVPIAVVGVWQSYYKTCHHAELSPQPVKGQRYRVVGYLDLSGRCPTCKEERAARKGTPR